jgi:hypothetical protein
LKNLRILVVALIVTGLAAAARGQGALYVNPVAIRISNSTADPGLFSFLGPGSTSRIFYGVDFGGFYDVPNVFPAGEIGIDVRDQILHANNASLNSFLVGPRIGIKPISARLHPYVEPFIGVGSTRAPNTAIKVNKAQYGVFAGADYDLGRRVSWRVIELGYSSLDTASGGTIGGTESIPSATLINFSTGLTFRLP